MLTCLVALNPYGHDVESRADVSNFSVLAVIEVYLERVFGCGVVDITLYLFSVSCSGQHEESGTVPCGFRLSSKL